MKRKSAWLTASVMCLASATCGAQDSDAPWDSEMTLSVGAMYTDNVRRVTGNEESQTVPEARLQLAVERVGRIEAHLATDLAYRGYQEGTFSNDDSLFGGADARLAWGMAADRLTLVVEDNYGQTLIEPRDVATPDNVQDFNFFSAGPDLVVPFGAKTTMTLSGRWSDVHFEQSAFGSERVQGSVALQREFGGGSNFGLDLSSQRVEFDGTPARGYDIHSAYLTYSIRGPRTELEAQAGGSEVHNEGNTFRHPRINISLRRQLSERSSLALMGGTGLTDAADALRRDRGFTGVPSDEDDVLTGPDFVEEDFLSGEWSISGSRTNLTLSANWRDEKRRFDASFSREALELGIAASRQLGSRLTGRLHGTRRDVEYVLSGIEYEEWSAGLEFGLQLSGHFSALLGAAHHEGGGDTASGPDTRDYAENRITLRLAYSPGR